MNILLFTRDRLEPKAINCDEFFLYKEENGEFSIRYTVLGANAPEDFILVPDDEVYQIQVI